MLPPMFNEDNRLNRISSNLSKIDSHKKSLRKTSSIQQLRSKSYSASTATIIPQNINTQVQPQQVTQLPSPDADENFNIPTINISKEELILINWSWNFDITNLSTLKQMKINSKKETNLTSNVGGTTETHDYKKANINQVNSIISCFQSHQFWQLIHDEIQANYPSEFTKFPSIQHQATAITNVFKMLIVSLNQQDFNHLNYYLHKLGKLHGRIFNIDSRLFEILCNCVIDKLVDWFGLSVFNFSLQDVYIKLFSFVCEFMIQSYLNDPILNVENSTSLMTPNFHNSILVSNPNSILPSSLQSQHLQDSDAISMVSTYDDAYSVDSRTTSNTLQTTNTSNTTNTSVPAHSNLHSSLGFGNSSDGTIITKKKSRLSRITFKSSSSSSNNTGSGAGSSSGSKIPRFSSVNYGIMNKKR